MKVIFLDIDGVMNSEIYWVSQHKKRWFRFSFYWLNVKSRLKYVLNGFEHKSYSLKEIMGDKRTYTFDYLFSRLKDSSDPRCWGLLRQLVTDTDCKICISSVWKRHFESDEDWNKALMQFGFSDGVYVGITGDRRTLRGTEIQEWLDKHPEVEKYAIIDDDSDMLPEQKPYFFQTDGYCGLSPNICYRIKRHFNNLA